MKISEDTVAVAATLSGLGSLGQTATTLARGARGAAVTALQKFLNTFGYGLQVDGIFGPATETAVKAVQAKLKLPVTGRWTASDDAALKAVNQSGVVDASQTDKQAIVRASVAAQPAPVTVTPSGQAVDTTGQPSASLTAPGFGEKLKEWMKSPWYWVGIAGIGVGIWWLWKNSASAPAQMAGVEMLGLPAKRKRRKSRKSKKGAA